MPRVSFTKDALCELRDCLARSKRPLGVSIVGPLDRDIRASNDPEEAWAVQKLYGPPQRWVLTLLPLEVFGERGALGSHVEEVSGLRVLIRAPEPFPRLRVELQGDAIRVYEILDP
jgi:hypothetical protein